jgi:hypothetical protein
MKSVFFLSQTNTPRDCRHVRWVHRVAIPTRFTTDLMMVKDGWIYASDAKRIHAAKLDCEVPNGTYDVIDSDGDVVLIPANGTLPDLPGLGPKRTHCFTIANPDRYHPDEIRHCVERETAFTFNARYLTDAIEGARSLELVFDDDMIFKKGTPAIRLNMGDRYAVMCPIHRHGATATRQEEKGNA